MDWKTRIRRAFRDRDAAIGSATAVRQPPDVDALPDEDVIEELAGHAAADYEAALAEGLDAAEARRRVDVEIAIWVDDPVLRRRRSPRAVVFDPPSPANARLAGLAQEVRHAFRLLRRQPAYSLIAILTMALGIGATTSLVSVAYGVLLKPLPWAKADRLVRLYETRHGSTSRFGEMMTNAAYMAWQEHPSTIDGLGAWTIMPMTLGGAGETVRARVAAATPSLFPLLGVQPLLGSPFQEGDGGPGREAKVLLSFGLWEERMAGSSDVLGRPIRLDGKDYRIAGVMPRGFSFPDRETRAWIPFHVPPVVVRNGGGSLSMFQAVARLRAGATPAQAAAEATARARTAPDPGLVAIAIFGSKGPIEVSAIPLLEAETAVVRPAILVFLAAVALLLFTATANVASVQLARAAARRREIAIRSALGAGGVRLVRQFLIESVIIGLCGGLAGLLLAVGVHRALPWLLPARFPRLDDVTIDWRVMIFAFAVSLVSGVVFGLLPALQARQVNVTHSLAEDGLAPVGGGSRSRAGRARACIMAGQIAIACVLLVGAALLTRSFVALVNADRGYDPMNVLTARLAVPDTNYTGVRRAALLTTLLDRVRAMPGVTHVAFTSALPLGPGDMLGSFTMRSPRTGATVEAQSAIRFVSPDYFAALGLRVVHGRVFTDADTTTSAPVVVVNRAFARKYLTDRPVGERLPADFGNGVTEAEVIGVVDDVHHRSVTDPPSPELYNSYLQQVQGLRFDQPTLVIRTTARPAELVPTLRALVRQQDSSLAFDAINTMEDLVSGSLAQPRLYAVLLATFAVFALTIAGVGLFGVLAYMVAQRSREIGVRTALGARPLDIVGLVVRQGLVIVLVGLAVGLAMAFAFVKSLSTFLYGVTAYDTLSFTTVPIVLLLVAGLACLVPARRAASVDPVRVLRG
jgi:predicted permease